MTSSAGSRQSRVVATDHLLATRVTSPDGAVRSDCIGAFQRELDYLCRTLRRLGVPSSDVEDLVHEVFLVVYRRWNDYDPSLPLKPWLFGITFRVASVHRRRSSREVPQGWLEVEDCSPHPEQAAEAERARAIVLAALEHLPLARRAVFVMHDLDEVAMRDVASVLSIPLFTAYSRLRKARKEFESAVQLIQKRANPR
jgi:RNA polymerase sigma-70 factor (ECF subfamily)